MIEPFHLWALATAAVVAAACAVVGTLLVVRRMSLLGDAISHAVLPGIAAALLAGGRPGSPLAFAGAVGTALLTVWLVRLLRSAGGLAEDAGAGVVFTTLFALGVLLVSAFASRIDLDPDCILYGILEFVPFDTVRLGSLDVPRGFLTGAAVLAVVSAAAAATWKLQVFTAFDPEAARAAGLPVAAVTGGLLAATALATVACFEVVGAVLVVALLVVPAAAAELLVHRLHHVAILAMALAVAGSVVGYLAAWHWNANAAGMIAVVLGVIYVLAVVLAPGDGVVARIAANTAYAWRVATEDRLAAAWRAGETGQPVARPRTPLEGAAGAWLAATGRVRVLEGRPVLSTEGRRAAETVVRSHRLWEAWLGRHVDLPLDHLHPPAEWVEHHLGAEMRRRIEAELGRAAGDPHGRQIPPES